ncbi:unnamed protein product, partial [Schistosoma margrebowiei]
TSISPIESCVNLFDGYYIEVIALLFIGSILFVVFFYPKAKYLQSLPATQFYYNPTTDEPGCFSRKFNCCRKTENQSLNVTDNFEGMENNTYTPFPPPPPYNNDNSEIKSRLNN